MATARPDAALLSLFGKRRKRTLWAMAQDLLRLKKSVGSKAELFQIEESDLMNVMFDQADKPCGKSFPEKLVRTVALVWERLGLPPTVTVASRGLAAALKVQLSEANLQAVRKALTPLIITICAMELEVAEGQIEGQELLIMGTELIKVYTSSRWDDVRHLDAQGLKLTDTFWGGERGFLQTKMSGAGCQTEVLPAWVARKHSISGKDWLGALLKKCEDQKLPWGKGYLLVDLDTAEPMEYEKKMRLTREILSDLDHAPAARLLEYPGNWSGKRYLPKGVAATHTEHGARGWVAGMGLQLGLPKPRLVFAGRWVPKDSVEDYARESRAAVLRNVEDVTLAIRKGWRPDESLTLDRMAERGVHIASMQDFVQYDPLRMNKEERAGDMEVIMKEEGLKLKEGVPPPPPGVPEPSEGMTQVVIGTTARGLEGKLHFLKPAKGPDANTAREVGCGKVLGREIRTWQVEEFEWPFISHVLFQRKCTHVGCQSKLKGLEPVGEEKEAQQPIDDEPAEAADSKSTTSSTDGSSTSDEDEEPEEKDDS